MLHSSENYFGKSSNHKSIKEVLRGSLGNSSNAVKSYKKSEHKWNKYLKALKKQNKIICRISKKYGSFRKLKKIKISNPRLPRSAAILSETPPVVHWILIPQFPLVVT